MKRIFILSIFLAGGIWGSGGELTSIPYANGAQKDPMQICQDDIQKYCANVQPGEGRLAQCIKENHGKLSNSCKKIVSKKRSQQNQRKIACEQDIAKLCSGVQPGSRRVTDCLRQQKEKLSSSCKQVKRW